MANRLKQGEHIIQYGKYYIVGTIAKYIEIVKEGDQFNVSSIKYRPNELIRGCRQATLEDIEEYHNGRDIDNDR